MSYTIVGISTLHIYIFWYKYANEMRIVLGLCLSTYKWMQNDCSGQRNMSRYFSWKWVTQLCSTTLRLNTTLHYYLEICRLREQFIRYNDSNTYPTTKIVFMYHYSSSCINSNTVEKGKVTQRTLKDHLTEWKLVSSNT